MNISQTLNRNGYVFIANWFVERSTIDIANGLGSVWGRASWYESRGKSVTQILTPKSPMTAKANSYSRRFGLSAFPFHTDLAHLLYPPRFLILRCIEGEPDVETKVIGARDFESIAGKENLDRALVRPRRSVRGRKMCVLPIRFRRDCVNALRWDPEFLIPMNSYASRIAQLVGEATWGGSAVVQMSNPGDTLIIDNYRNLHGRGPVPLHAMTRRIERVFMNEINL